MSNPKHEEIVRRGYAVAEAMDVPGFVNTFTPDGTFTDEAFGNVFTGPKELATMLQIFGSAFPDMHRELHRFYSVDDMVIVELTPPRDAQWTARRPWRLHSTHGQANERALL